ncbi:MAG TPA: hypothetical protein VHJ83_10970, partial [Micromonosporaceae bacterium]|nr:hypothetical protein [Micromonosporaceae bacterium]
MGPHEIHDALTWLTPVMPGLRVHTGQSPQATYQVGDRSVNVSVTTVRPDRLPVRDPGAGVAAVVANRAELRQGQITLHIDVSSELDPHLLRQAIGYALGEAAHNLRESNWRLPRLPRLFRRASAIDGRVRGQLAQLDVIAYELAEAVDESNNSARLRAEAAALLAWLRGVELPRLGRFDWDRIAASYLSEPARRLVSHLRPAADPFAPPIWVPRTQHPSQSPGFHDEITATAIPDSDFQPRARPAEEPDLDDIEITDALQELAGWLPGLDLPGSPDEAGQAARVRLGRGQYADLEVHPAAPDELGESQDGTPVVARTQVEVRGGRTVLRVAVSSRVHPDQVARAIGHELTETRHDLARRGPVSRLLRRGSRVSGHIAGRFTELEVIAGDLADLQDPTDPAAARLHAEARALVGHLRESELAGVDPQSFERLIARHLSEPARRLVNEVTAANVLGPAADLLRQAGVDPYHLVTLGALPDSAWQQVTDALRELDAPEGLRVRLHAVAIRFAAEHGAVTTATNPDGLRADPAEMARLIRYFGQRIAAPDTDPAQALTNVAERLDAPGQPDQMLADLADRLAEERALGDRAAVVLEGLVAAEVIRAAERLDDGRFRITSNHDKQVTVAVALSPVVAAPSTGRPTAEQPARILLPADSAADQAAVTEQVLELTRKPRGVVRKRLAARRPDTPRLVAGSSGRGRLTASDHFEIAQLRLDARTLGTASDPAERAAARQRIRDRLVRLGLDQSDPFHQAKRDAIRSQADLPTSVMDLVERYGRARPEQSTLDEITGLPEGEDRAARVRRFAESLLADALTTVVGDGLVTGATRGPDGDIRLTGPDREGRLRTPAVNDLRIWLYDRIVQGTGLARLRAETAAVLGADAAQALGRPRAVGALAALGQRYADPGADQPTRDAVGAVAAEILVDTPQDAWDYPDLPENARSLVDQVQEDLRRGEFPELAEIADPYRLLRYGEHIATAEALLDRLTGSGDPIAEAGELAATLREMAAALTERATARETEAQAARNTAAERREDAAKEPDESDTTRRRDKLSAERRRVAEKEAGQHDGIAARHQRIADRYADAATKARLLADALAGLRNDPDTAAEVRQAVADYRAALDELTPPRAAWHAAMLTGHLPHLRELAARLNDLLAAHGIDTTVTTDLLQARLHAEFRTVATPDGITLRLGRSTAGEVRLRLRLDNPVEVTGFPMRASESILGNLSQFGWGGRTLGATAGHSFTAGASMPVSDLV